MKDKADKRTANLLQTNNARRQAAFGVRQREMGRKQRALWLTDDEFERVKTYVEFQRSKTS